MKLTEYRFYFSVYKISYHPSWRHTCVWNKKKVNQSHSKVKSSSSSCSILCSERNIDHFFNFSVGMNRVVFDITIIMASDSDTFNIYTLQIKAQIYLRSDNPLHQMFGMSPYDINTIAIYFPMGFESFRLKNWQGSYLNTLSAICR